MSGDETRRRLAERARQAGLAVSAGRERLAAEAERPLAPGDLFADRRTAELPVEWAVIGELGAEAAGERGAGGGGTGTAAARLLVVPADALPLRGPADVAVAPEAGAEPPLGPLTLRCAFGIRIDATRLDPGTRTGRLPAAAVLEALERHRAAAEAAGRPFGTPLEREAEIDPEYRHWVESVLVPAREAMAAAESAAPPVEPPAPEPPPPVSLADRRRRGALLRGPWALAAAVLLLLAAGLLAGLLRQRGEIAELRAAERRMAEEVADLLEEREGLAERLATLDAEHGRQLAARDEAAREIQDTLRDRIADLDRSLREALSPRAWVDLPFELLVPWEPERGPPEEFELPADAERLGLLLQHETDDHRSYRLELYRSGGERPIWTADDVPYSDALLGFVVVLPSELFAPGKYRWVLYGEPAGGRMEELAEFEMVVVGEGERAGS